MLIWEVKENLSLQTQSKGSWVCKETAFPSWVSAKATPVSDKNSEHQTRKEAGKIWLFSLDALWETWVYGARRPRWWRNWSNGANQVNWYFGRTCGSNTSTSPWGPDCWIRRRGQRGKGKKIHKMAVFVWCTVNKNLTTKAFRKIEKLWETVSPSNTVMPVSFETLRRGHNGLLSKLKKPLIRTTDRSKAIAGRTGGKPPPGWKHTLPKHEMVVRV